MDELIKISELPKATQVKNTDVTVIVQDGVTKQLPTPILEQSLLDKTDNRYVTDDELTSKAVLKTEKGAPNGVASLDANGNLAQGITTGTSGNVVFQGSGTELDPLEGLVVANGKVEEGNTQAVSGGEVYESANNLFEENSELELPSMLVTRILTTGAATNYNRGTYQTKQNNSVYISIPASGSTATRHYFNTENKLKPNNNMFEFTINTDIVNYGVGIGVFVSDKYNTYTINYNGVIRKVIDGISTELDTTLLNLKNNDLVVIRVDGGYIYFYINDTLKYSELLNESFKDKDINIVSAGFGPYTFLWKIQSGEFKNKIIELIKNNASELSNTYYSYNAVDKEFSVFSKVRDNLFNCYKIKNEVDMRDLVYVNYWRITEAKIAYYNNGNFEVTNKYAIYTGESEFVLKQNAQKDDFTGGAHGDEIAINFSFMPSGIEIKDLTRDIPLTPCNGFYYSVYSSLHETAENGVHIPNHPIIGYHTKLTKIINGGYSTYNKVNWNVNSLITLSYGLSCIGKSAGDNTTFNKYLTEFVNTSSNTGLSNEVNGSSIYYYGSYLSCEVNSLYKGTDLNNENGVLFYNSRIGDTKYYRRTPPTNVKINDILEIETHVVFK